MVLLLSLFKLPFVNRIINTMTSNTKTTVTSSLLVGLSAIGYINQEQVNFLSGLDPFIVMPILLGFMLTIYIPKILNYFNNKKLDSIKLTKEEKELTIDILESEIKIRELEHQLNG